MSHSTLDLASATITTISQALRQRHLSPVELITATLERIDALQLRLQCFTTVTPEYALHRARQAEQEIGHGRYRGPLHGIPYTLKDVVATHDIRTTFGDPKGVNYRPPASATVHVLLEEAGGILVGKVVSEIGRGSTGPVGCRNAWDLRCSPGTSSSGSGAAVAAALGLASIGTDTGGSVRHPASNSGLVGMKATFGRISGIRDIHCCKRRLSPCTHHAAGQEGGEEVLAQAAQGLDVWTHCPTFSTTPASAVRVGVSPRDEGTIRELGRDYGYGVGCLRSG
jgi:Asp-tRNA(Asn)/Glu-tRNA(Gln) amidotransferase A subunit family amidase